MRMDGVQDIRIERLDSADLENFCISYTKKAETLLPSDGVVTGFDSEQFKNSVKLFAGIKESAEISIKSSVDILSQMYKGSETNQTMTNGLKNISQMKVNGAYRYSNERQHARV